MFTGRLRPFPQSERRTVPERIPRPDYADHPKGYPLSEQAVKGSGQIKILDDEEIEGEIIARHNLGSMWVNGNKGNWKYILIQYIGDWRQFSCCC